MVGMVARLQQLLHVLQQSLLAEALLCCPLLQPTYSELVQTLKAPQEPRVWRYIKTRKRAGSIRV